MSDNDNFGKGRRDFIKGLFAAGVAGSVISVPKTLLAVSRAPLKTFDIKEYEVFRNACPRNCYDTCSIKTYVKDGVVQYVEGAPESTFTHGNVCVKGFTYPRRQYSPDRIKYPMLQEGGRRSGKWRRISWDEAMDRISDKILDIKKRDGSLLGLGLTKYSGNFGVTNNSVEGMMSSLGYTTRFVGTPCWPAGMDAQNYDLGDMWSNDPEDIVKAKYIIVWGANPAWNSMHSMRFLYEAKRRGAKLVVIDPIFTQTAAKADEYWQVKSGCDGALALGMARHLLDANLVDWNFVSNHSLGAGEFISYLKNDFSVEKAAEISGIPAERIRAIAEEFATATVATVWIGYGMQRHTNGGATVRAVDAFVALTGNIGLEGGGARYAQLKTWIFNYDAMNQKKPEGSVGFIAESAKVMGECDFADKTKSQYSDRAVNINKTAQDILDTKEPNLKMLWMSCKNVFAQDFDRNKMIKAFDQLEMVVAVEQFFTESVQNSDIVLPVTTLFEEWTANVSYWHYWLSLNEQAVKPMHEAKSNLAIAAALSKAMNAKSPGSCTFAQEVDEKEWMIKEFNQNMYDYFGINSWEDLKNGPAKAKLATSASWSDLKFKTPSGKYEFLSELCQEHGFDALPKYVEGRKFTAEFRLLTPHVQFGLHSQFINIDWTMNFYPEPFVYIHPEAAKEKGIKDSDWVKVSSILGEVKVKAKLTNNVARDCVVMYEAWFKDSDFNVQILVDDMASDMGAYKTGMPGVAIHDQFVNIALVSGGK